MRIETIRQDDYYETVDANKRRAGFPLFQLLYYTTTRRYFTGSFIITNGSYVKLTINARTRTTDKRVFSFDVMSSHHQQDKLFFLLMLFRYFREQFIMRVISLRTTSRKDSRLDVVIIESIQRIAKKER